MTTDAYATSACISDEDSRRERGVVELIDRRQSLTTITEEISSVVEQSTAPRAWLVLFAGATLLSCLLLYAIAWLFFAGVGIWGVNIPVAWGLAIVNFVFWIGVGHAGTLISSALLLMRQEWRKSISRVAETMTLFALACAGLFPLLHLGRPWFFYWLVPYPNTMGVWPQFRSALVWDVFAILTYMTVSLLFWYLGMIPDLATMRDRAKHRVAVFVYRILAVGWRGEAAQWHSYEATCRLLAGLATVLVVSVHSIVAFDFAITTVPGWHSTIFPPYFVAGAMHSGFAMVLVLLIPLRRGYRLESFITARHFQFMARILICTSLFVAYGYAMELFGQWYSGKQVEWHLARQRVLGAYAPLYWTLIAANVGIPQLLWIPALRANRIVLWLAAVVVLSGMWLERYVIVVCSLREDFLPSSWGQYSATGWDWALFLGTFGLFLALFLLFVRLLPMISMFEVKHLLAKASE